MVSRQLRFSLLALVGAISALAAKRTFPDWTAEHLGLSGVWERTKFVAVGELHHVRPVGVQRPHNLPQMASPTIRQIYWCEGDFEFRELVRGEELARSRIYLWGAIEPGCKLDKEGAVIEGESLTQVWFMREEGAYLRPVVDGGGPFFFTFHVKWEPHTAGLGPEGYFGVLLLSPRATGLSTHEYAQTFIKPAGLGCWILGRSDCIQRIRALAALANRELRDAACAFLDSQFREKCTQ